MIYINHTIINLLLKSKDDRPSFVLEGRSIIIITFMYIYVLYVGVYVCSIERSMDLDTVPKTEKLDTQFVSTRPKMPHNPPSRSHIVSVTTYVRIYIVMYLY